MITLPPPRIKRKADSTIALINIVFLMLIFFMLAGRISAPLDQDVNLALTEQSPPSHLKDAVIITADGSLYHQGIALSSAAFWELYSEAGGEGDLRIVADRELPAHILLTRIAELRLLGVNSVRVITQNYEGE